MTTDRYDSYSPAWSPDGKWLYFLSDRTSSRSFRAPGDRASRSRSSTSRPKIYQVSMKPGERSPFQPDDELYVAPKADDKDKKDRARKGRREARLQRRPRPPRRSRRRAARRCRRQAGGSAPVDLTGIETRLIEVPLPRRQLQASLATDGKRLYFMSRDVSSKRTAGAQDAADRQQEPEAEDVPGRRAELRAVARPQEADGAQGERDLRRRRGAPKRRPSIAKSGRAA